MEEPQQPVDQQVTSKTPATKPKNPKRVAAGKAVAERTRIAREAQKKALIESQILIAQAKKDDLVVEPAAPPSVADSPAPEPPSAKVLTTTQWLSVISIVSLVGVYYKREEIKNVFAKKAAPPSPILPRATPPVDAASKTTIRKMD